MISLIATLRSIRFNIGLIAVLAALFALGTIIPQRGDAPQQVDQFLASHPSLGTLWERLGLFHLYHTPLVLSLLALLAINITVCRVWPHLKNLKFEISKLKSRGQFNFPREHWGSLINHIGLVVVLTGGLIKGLWGFEEFLMILPGQDKPLGRFPTSTISLFDFRVDFYEGTRTPKLFESDLQAAVNGQVKRQKLRVNAPLSLSVLPFAPLRLYQASWGATGMFKKAQLQLGGQSVDLKMNEPSAIPKTPFHVTGKMLLPDFTIRQGHAETKSLEWNNPALAVTFAHAGFESRPIWLLLYQPGIAFEEQPDGTLRQASPPPFQIKSLDPVFFSGIQAAYDPGFPVILAGVTFILAGFGLYLSATAGAPPPAGQRTRSSADE